MLLLLVVGLTGCPPAAPPPAPPPPDDPVFRATYRELNRLEGETLDSDYADPRFDPLLAKLRQIEHSSPRYQEAREKIAEIEEARVRAARRKSDVQAMVEDLRSRPGASRQRATQAVDAEEMHRQLVQSLGGSFNRARTTPLDTRQPIERAKAQLANHQKYIGFLEQDLITICGPVGAPSRQDANCRSRQIKLDRARAELEQTKLEVRRLLQEE